MCDIPHTYPTKTGKLNEAIIRLGQETCLMINSIISPTKRPYAKAKIQNQIIQCLFDTGADISCINSTVIRKLPQSISRKLNTIGTEKPIKAAGGQTLNVQGIQQIKLEIDGREVEHPFLIIDDLNESVI